ncbi:hypothetical protein [Hymenobacter sp. YC55]|uniref:hypothetical protein n=1 Tax=Hymenobacter sp. YC55 TaxID=3034019 RepID=UPI0023F7B773|nr:hypothetical protein [Hymenobacter sp. YC55]MDF7810921.1 hypothetical protein [Hymenobacter sp. YC55]
MLTATMEATAMLIASPTTKYTGPLGRKFKKEAEVKLAQNRHLLTLSAMRSNIMSMMCEADLFAADEQLRANDRVFQCESIPQLHRWYCNVYRVFTERRNALRLPFVDGSTFLMAVAS